jgi:rhamnulokinase
MKFCAAIDLGGSSGRVAIGSLDSGSLQITEVHRFKHEPREVAGIGLLWDWKLILEEINKGLLKALDYGEIISIGVDSWAVDYGLLDSTGNLIENPFCYRDSRTDGIMDAVSSSLGPEWIYQKTGIQFIFFNTAYQLHAARDSQAMREASTFLMLPDLINFIFTGVKSNDITNASTTQLLNAHTREWDWELIAKLDIPQSIFPELHSPGATIGQIRGHGALDGISVIAVGSHDTASAVAGTPLPPSHRAAYISSGTWSLVGLELDAPVTDARALSYNLTNEAGVSDRIRFIKNVSGMWLLEESIRHWRTKGINLTAAELVAEAKSLPRNQIIDTNDSRFEKPGAMPERIATYCQETNQEIPQTPYEYARCIFDSLAVAYADALNELVEASAHPVEEIIIVGGGSSNELLNQLTADETGLNVIAGPVEATVLGNIIVQLMTAGLVSNLEEGRLFIANSVERKTFTPANGRK